MLENLDLILLAMDETVDGGCAPLMSLCLYFDPSLRQAQCRC